MGGAGSGGHKGTRAITLFPAKNLLESNQKACYFVSKNVMIPAIMIVVIFISLPYLNNYQKYIYLPFFLFSSLGHPILKIK